MDVDIDPSLLPETMDLVNDQISNRDEPLSGTYEAGTQLFHCMCSQLTRIYRNNVQQRACVRAIHSCSSARDKCSSLPLQSQSNIGQPAPINVSYRYPRCMDVV